MTPRDPRASGDPAPPEPGRNEDREPDDDRGAEQEIERSRGLTNDGVTGAERRRTGRPHPGRSARSLAAGDRDWAGPGAVGRRRSGDAGNRGGGGGITGGRGEVL